MDLLNSKETNGKAGAQREVATILSIIFVVGFLPGCTTMGIDGYGNERPPMAAVSASGPALDVHRYAIDQGLLLSQCSTARGVLSWDGNNCVIRPNYVAPNWCVELMVEEKGDPDWADAVCAGWRPAVTGRKQAGLK